MNRVHPSVDAVKFSASLLFAIACFISLAEVPASAQGVIERDGQRYIHADLVRASGVYTYSWHQVSGNLILRDGVTSFMLFAGRDRASKGYVDFEVRAPLKDEGGEPYVSEDFIRDHLRLDPVVLILRAVEESAVGERLDPDAETPGISEPEPPTGEIPVSFENGPPAMVAGTSSVSDFSIPGERVGNLLSLLTGREKTSKPRLKNASLAPAGEGVIISLGFDSDAPSFDVKTVDRPRALLVTLYGVSSATDLIGSHPGSPPVTEMLIEPADGGRMTLMILCSEPVNHASARFGSTGITVSVTPAVSGGSVDDSREIVSPASEPQGRTTAFVAGVHRPVSITAGDTAGGEGAAERLHSLLSPMEIRSLKPLRKENSLDGALGSGMALRGLKVDLDPGHGGRDPGIETGEGPPEKDINLRVSLILAKLLNQAGADVRLSRESDKTLSGSERVQFFKERISSLDISVHCGHTANPLTSGPLVITPNEIGLSAAEAISGAMVNSLGAETRDPIVAPVSIFKGPNPAVLIEVGFLSHLEERARLHTDDYQARVARAILYGIFHGYRKDRIPGN